ncbi:hypothetical protein PF005_g8691 [Phytophthora fragariae]|uniref:Uncharacterized protein n=1 Tax=Phytophthora fragariae TaxID=53985 RepID=A0A6A3UC29_9STRA|nr:hypothetical protein PF003_g35750 [Phytophthora fragariae]KAE8942782.1 hypothetical protein PF009_g7468 [Phytophthora fragariae]KAE9017212.1 hypothetical protein PF011_g6801 [Phytophthora fragariae]KAE9108996.1 hypothetical protein PF010_g11700 [Phytophthora fragariae]KAE9123182.1 hypothetical protein PF007_g7155 [Phytophthora fragariae]
MRHAFSIWNSHSRTSSPLLSWTLAGCWALACALSSVTGVTRTIANRMRNTLTTTDAWRLCCLRYKRPCLIGPFNTEY